MKQKWRLFLLAGTAAVTMTACDPQERTEIGDPISVAEATEDTTRREIPEGAIADESGDFVYTGKLQQVGDDENGYIMVPLGFIPFQEDGVEGLTQYSSTTGSTIITLERYADVDYETAANSIRYYMAENEEIDGLTGATVTVNGYNALQLYCVYPADGVYQVVWLIEDPENPAVSSYYLAMEFTNDNRDIIACSSTFQTPADYAASAAEEE